MSPPRALWVLSRPRLLPYVLALPLAGFAWAHWDRALTIRGAAGLPWVLLAWALLNAGTLWLNAALDRDQGEVLMGRAVRPPPGIVPAAYLALSGCAPIAAIGDPVAGAACAGCALLAVLYSHPRVVWKGHPVGGPLVNVVGYGVLSPLAGWALVDVSANPRTLAVWGLANLGILGTYFAAQAFQQDEDRARGYRTLVATHGPATTLRVTRMCIGAALAGGMALAVLGWLPRSCLIGAVGWVVIDRFLAAWAREPGGGGEAHARGFARRMLWTWALGIVLAFSQYAWESWQGGPVAGLATVAGRPTDRPALSPAALRAWERAQQGSW